MREDSGSLPQLQRGLLRRARRETFGMQDVSLETDGTSHVQATEEEDAHLRDGTLFQQQSRLSKTAATAEGTVRMGEERQKA